MHEPGDSDGDDLRNTNSVLSFSGEVDLGINVDDEGVLRDKGGICCIILSAEAENIDLYLGDSSLLYKLGHDSALLKSDCDDISDFGIILTFSVEGNACFNPDFDVNKDRIEEPIPEDDGGFEASSNFGIIHSTGILSIKGNTGFLDVDKVGNEGIEGTRNGGEGNNSMCLGVSQGDRGDLGLDNTPSVISSVKIVGDDRVCAFKK